MRQPSLRYNEARRQFFARFLVNGKKRYFSLGGQLGPAQEEFEKLLIRFSYGVKVIPAPETPGQVTTFGDAAGVYLERQKSNPRCSSPHYATIKFHLKRMEAFAEGVLWRTQISALRPEDLIGYLETMRIRGWTGGTLYHASVFAKAPLRYCARARLIEYSPWDIVPAMTAAAKEFRTFSPADAGAILGSARGMDRWLLVILYETAARPSELSRARWEDLQGGQIVLQQHKTRRRTNRPRVLTLTERAQAALDKFPRKASGLIFPSRLFRQAETKRQAAAPDIMLSRRAWERIVARAVADLDGLGDVTPYCFRHSRLTHLAAEGVDLVTLAQIAGNTPQMIASRYVHPAPEHVERALSL